MTRCLVCLLLVSQLMACASTSIIKTEESSLPTLHNAEKVLAINEWRLLGRLSVRNMRQSWFTTLEWNHRKGIDDLTLSTSLGGVVAKILYSKQGILLTDEEGVLQHVSEEELASLLGYSAPLKHMKYWVRGVLSPEFQGPSSREYLDDTVLFEQGGWNVQLERFQTYGEVVLPARVTLIKEDLKIKLVVDKWWMEK
ncbi:MULTISPECIES: lipoprotein insertase outer membrane protein LolB [Cycloclasticus]|jgi:outer membrane lipoprotein LolB|nr:MULTISPECIES: lipoprotein insertase outer membrane protein LolB [Cycloclasticus]MBV1899026.1 lipoprotein insertase outer membrane protein LolB [Cycloclasticus sp.]MDF1829933.1 lipoprotein insertase outer membrane protein LolB [Cycloclasticus pugetii]